jgi:hypothetical protein
MLNETAILEVPKLSKNLQKYITKRLQKYFENISKILQNLLTIV